MTNKHNSFTAKLVAIEDVAMETKRFRFLVTSHAPDPFLPGQFFLLQAQGKEGIVNRAYSIASSPALLPEFDLLIKRVPKGKSTTFLWGLKGGEEILFRGPMGRFGLRNPELKQVFIATGTGLAPMRSFWQFLSEKGSAPSLEVIFGVRNQEYLFCIDELSTLSKINPHFSYSVCLSRSQGNEYFQGRVTDFVRQKKDSDFMNAEIYLCGSKEMVEEMKEILTEKGVGTNRIGIESW